MLQSRMFLTNHILFLRYPGNIDLCVVSHGDMSCVGGLPFVYKKRNMECPVLMTEPVHKFGRLFLFETYLSFVETYKQEPFSINTINDLFDKVERIRFLQSYHVTSHNLQIIPLCAGGTLGASVWCIKNTISEESIYLMTRPGTSPQRITDGCWDTFASTSNSVWCSSIARSSAPVPCNQSAHKALTAPTKASMLVLSDSELSHENATVDESIKDGECRLIRVLLDVIQKGHGTVLIPYDASPRVFELILLLEELAAAGQQGTKTPTTLAGLGGVVIPHSVANMKVLFASPVASALLQAARGFVSWTSATVRHEFDSKRITPFSKFNTVRTCHSPQQARLFLEANAASTVVIVAAGVDLDSGISRSLAHQVIPKHQGVIALQRVPREGSLGFKLLSGRVSHITLMEIQTRHLQPEEISQLAANPESDIMNARQHQQQQIHASMANTNIIEQDIISAVPPLNDISSTHLHEQTIDQLPSSALPKIVNRAGQGYLPALSLSALIRRLGVSGASGVMHLLKDLNVNFLGLNAGDHISAELSDTSGDESDPDAVNPTANSTSRARRKLLAARLEAVSKRRRVAVASNAASAFAGSIEWGIRNFSGVSGSGLALGAPVAADEYGTPLDPLTMDVWRVTSESASLGGALSLMKQNKQNAQAKRNQQKNDKSSTGDNAAAKDEQKAKMAARLAALRKLQESSDGAERLFSAKLAKYGGLGGGEGEGKDSSGSVVDNAKRNTAAEEEATEKKKSQNEDAKVTSIGENAAPTDVENDTSNSNNNKNNTNNANNEIDVIAVSNIEEDAAVTAARILLRERYGVEATLTLPQELSIPISCSVTLFETVGAASSIKQADAATIVDLLDPLVTVLVSPARGTSSLPAVLPNSVEAVPAAPWQNERLHQILHQSPAIEVKMESFEGDQDASMGTGDLNVISDLKTENQLSRLRDATNRGDGKREEDRLLVRSDDDTARIVVKYPNRPRRKVILSPDIIQMTTNNCIAVDIASVAPLPPAAREHLSVSANQNLIPEEQRLVAIGRLNSLSLLSSRSNNSGEQIEEQRQQHIGKPSQGSEFVFVERERSAISLANSLRTHIHKKFPRALVATVPGGGIIVSEHGAAPLRSALISTTKSHPLDPARLGLHVLTRETVGNGKPEWMLEGPPTATHWEIRNFLVGGALMTYKWTSSGREEGKRKGF